MGGFTDLKFTDSSFTGKTISELPNQPNDAGMTGEELKARFDLVPKIVIALTGINNILDFIESQVSAGSIGAVNGEIATTVQEYLDNLKESVSKGSTALEEYKALLKSEIGASEISGLYVDAEKTLQEMLNQLNLDGANFIGSEQIDLTDTSEANVFSKLQFLFNNLKSYKEELHAQTGASKIGMKPLYADDITDATVEAKLMKLIDLVLTIDKFTPRGTIDNQSQLPSSGNAYGDFFYIRTSDEQTLEEWIWIKSEPDRWDYLGLTSLYVLSGKADVDLANVSNTAMKTAVEKANVDAEHIATTTGNVQNDLNTINANNWVTSSRILKDAVTEDKIKSDAITTLKIQDENVTLAKLEQYIQTVLGSVSNPNLLDNGAMQIWQRGETFTGGGGISSKGVTADRWAVTGSVQSNPKYTVEKGYSEDLKAATIKIKRTEATGAGFDTRIYQKKEITINSENITVSFWGTEPLANIVELRFLSSGTELERKTITATEKETKGNFVCYTGIFKNSIFGYDNILIYIGRPDIDVPDVYEIEYANIKLEEGSIATPFIAPDETLELVKCQAYYERVGPSQLNILHLGYLPQGSGFVETNLTYKPKKNMPVISWANADQFRILATKISTGGQGEILISNIYAQYKTETTVRLTLEFSSTLTDEAYAILQQKTNQSVAWIDVSAEPV